MRINQVGKNLLFIDVWHFQDALRHIYFAGMTQHKNPIVQIKKPNN
jgi:hypothetical protein